LVEPVWEHGVGSGELGVGSDARSSALPRV
jgi:hypothetical protein